MGAAAPGSTRICSTVNTSPNRSNFGDRATLAPFIKGEMSLGVLGDTVEQLYWSAEHKELKYQLGDACIIDQALGQWHANLYGLGDVLDREKVKTSLATTFRHNFKGRLGDIYDPCRVFGMDDESGTVIATWPKGSGKPAVPVPYAQETMHGMEYAFGQMLMSYGMLEEGVKVTAGVRDRYDGAKRNPWNEIECGSNYARSMASWAPSSCSQDSPPTWQPVGSRSPRCCATAVCRARSGRARPRTAPSSSARATSSSKSWVAR